jgi:hypothetical protein
MAKKTSRGKTQDRSKVAGGKIMNCSMKKKKQGEFSTNKKGD